MGVYLRGDWYRYKKQIVGRTYYEARLACFFRHFLADCFIVDLKRKIHLASFSLSTALTGVFMIIRGHAVPFGLWPSDAFGADYFQVTL